MPDNDARFGTDGIELLEQRYRELYWNVNEYHIIGNEACIAEAERLEKQMQKITDTLGYTPVA